MERSPSKQIDAAEGRWGREVKEREGEELATPASSKQSLGVIPPRSRPPFVNVD